MIDYASLYNTLPLNLGTAFALIMLLMPFLSFVLLMLLRRRRGGTLVWLATGIHLATAIIAGFILSLVMEGVTFHTRTIWFTIADSQIAYPFTIGLWIDTETALMLLVVTIISFLVHLYSIEYMKGDKGYTRYFALLGFFTFAMLGVVLMDNLLTIFVFWELVGVASYALIGFWNERKAALDAGKKAFVTNRIGDAGFLVGLMILWSQFGTLDLQVLESLMQQSVLTSNGTWLTYFRAGGSVFENVAPAYWLSLAGIGLFFGTIGKSAQFPLQTWLPDAMEGPTPASALIHAATMVAAGVYLLAQVFVLLTGDALTVIAIIGAVTAFMAAIAALSQHDIKKVLAYSTISQLGYMVVAMGVGAYDAALFHLITHASFKACLFLGSGAIIHAMQGIEPDLDEADKARFDPQDMRWMGGLRRKMPWTFATYLVAAMALAGLPLFSGFLSKDAILAGSMAWADAVSNHQLTYHSLVVVLAFATSLLTAFYMGRQVLLVFFGDFRASKAFASARDSFYRLHESPWIMRIPMVILAILSLGIVYSWNPLDGAASWVTQVIFTPLLAVPGDYSYLDRLAMLKDAWHHTASYIAIALAVSGAGMAYLIFRPTGKAAQQYHTVVPYQNFFAKLSFQHWYMDRIYRLLVIRPVMKLATFTAWFDKQVIDRAVDSVAIMNVVLAHLVAFADRTLVDGMVNLLAKVAGWIGKLARTMQTGNVQTYFIITLLAVIGMLVVLLF